MKKLLVVGGSHADIPIIQAAQKKDYFVITSGNNPKDLGHQFSDQYCPEDYSNPQKILALAKSLNIDAICASANDFSALSCAYTAEKLHLPGHDTFETALTIHHKDKFRTFALKHDLTVPKAIHIHKDRNIYTTDIKQLTYPLIVKPIDLSGGKGVTKVESKKYLENAIQKAFSVSYNDTIVIEEFVNGSNHGYSTFIKNGKVVFAFMDDEHYFINPYLVSGASTSLFYTKQIAQKLNDDLKIIASELQLTDGLLHVQFILKGQIPYIIEICRRTPGDLYVKLVKYATEFDMATAIVDFATGNPVTINHNKKISYITRHCVMGEKTGYIKKVDYGNLSSKIFDKFIFYKRGDYIANPMTYKAEIDFIKYNSRNEMQNIVNTLTNTIKIRYAL
ncbi:ATP-grasp domain-containing protein [Sulfurovum sp. ST-21]|uniref:ATP-grasp domain-containing protein n=1 Tax=Sulfurovum indicum TaxID=2779528 RepID=A0A7M1S456_9BACT|nr:ATP-grasp domain-containing protein [Sulfurovum indicum]QOR62205.1 ATP-grasp domain-containing protein [Sulfurovum indicum]